MVKIFKLMDVGELKKKKNEIQRKSLFLIQMFIVRNKNILNGFDHFLIIKQKSEMNSELVQKIQNQIDGMAELNIIQSKSSDLKQSTFEAIWEATRIKISKVLIKAKTKINDGLYLQKMQTKMSLLNSQKKYLVEEGLIHLYVDIYDQKKIAKKQGKKQMSAICFQLLRTLQDLIKYFFLEHELRQFRKYRSTILSNFSQNLEGQDQAMEKKIRMRVSNEKCSNLFKNYLKDQQAKKNKELCRICYKKIEISQLAKHVDCCGKKTYIKEQLLQNFKTRMEIIEKLQKLLNELVSQNQDLKIVEKIQKIVHFYQNISNYKKNKRTSMRYYDKNCPLFFYEHESFERNHNEVKLIIQLSFFQDKAFCLNKKLELIENQFCNENGANNATLKYSLNSNFKKYERAFIQLSENPDLNKQFEKKKRTDPSSNSKETLNQISEIKQEDLETQLPTIVQKKLKRRSNCERYSISAKSDSNASQTDYCSISINDFSILKLLGKGAFGKVYLVRRNKTKDFYALKVIKIDKNWGQNQLEFIKNEYGIYKKIGGDHLVTATFSFQQKNAQFFVLQYMPGGDLARVLQQNIYLDEPVAKFYLAQILLAIEHLHNSEIVHRDLKPENIVLDSKGHIKLTDFGLSQIRVRNKLRRARDSQIEQKQQADQFFSTHKKSMMKNRNGKKLIGTPDYIAPQIIEGVSLVNPTIDWWSFGVIAYQMLIGCRPFCANTVDQIIANIEKGEIQLPEIGLQQDMLSPVAADFLKKLLTKNFQERLGFKGVQQIKYHDFFKGIDWDNLKKAKPPLISQMENNGKSQKIEFLSQKIQLRKQIQILMDSQMENKLQQLRNYVRYDLLRAETLQSVELRVIKKQSRLRKLKSIACNFAKNEPNQIKYKPAMSSEDENDE